MIKLKLSDSFTKRAGIHRYRHFYIVLANLNVFLSLIVVNMLMMSNKFKSNKVKSNPYPCNQIYFYSYLSIHCHSGGCNCRQCRCGGIFYRYSCSFSRPVELRMFCPWCFDREAVAWLATQCAVTLMTRVQFPIWPCHFYFFGDF